MESLYISLFSQSTNVALIKDFSFQHCFIVMTEKWKKSIYHRGTFGDLLTDLLKAFDCIRHEFLTAKLSASGFDLKALKLIYNYINNIKQRVKINESLSERAEFLFGVPQGSIFGPLPFIIFLCNFFLF